LTTARRFFAASSSRVSALMTPLMPPSMWLLTLNQVMAGIWLATR